MDVDDGAGGVDGGSDTRGQDREQNGTEFGRTTLASGGSGEPHRCPVKEKHSNDPKLFRQWTHTFDDGTEEPRLHRREDSSSADAKLASSRAKNRARRWRCGHTYRAETPRCRW